jgi:hypothetical protein
LRRSPTFVLYCALDEITKRYLQNRFFSGLLVQVGGFRATTAMSVSGHFRLSAPVLPPGPLPLLPKSGL